VKKKQEKTLTGEEYLKYSVIIPTEEINKEKDKAKGKEQVSSLDKDAVEVVANASEQAETILQKAKQSATTASLSLEGILNNGDAFRKFKSLTAKRKDGAIQEENLKFLLEVNAIDLAEKITDDQKKKAIRTVVASYFNPESELQLALSEGAVRIVVNNIYTGVGAIEIHAFAPLDALPCV
jgi:hypothetical protein